jgi:hypothetical protein
MAEKPPIGLVPRRIRWRQRIDEILLAMTRYSDVDMPIPVDWIEELQSLMAET